MNYQDLVTAYALGDLSQDERRDFEAHAGKDLLAQARDYEAILASLGSSLEPVAPSATLKANVMSAVRFMAQEEQPPISDPDCVSTPVMDSPAPSVSDDSSASDASMHQLVGPGVRRLPASAFALAASAAVVFAGLWGYSQHVQLREAQTQIATLSAQQQSLLEQISMADDVTLAKGELGSSMVSILYSPSHGMAGISTTGLPDLPDGQAYMLWLYDAEGNIVGSGTLDMGGSTARLSEMVDQDLSRVVEFGISVERTDASAPSAKPTMLDTMRTDS